jgi:hypothetical protein
MKGASYMPVSTVFEDTKLRKEEEEEEGERVIALRASSL